MKSSYIGKKIGQVLYLNRLPGWNSLKKIMGCLKIMGQVTKINLIPRHTSYLGGATCVVIVVSITRSMEET